MVASERRKEKNSGSGKLDADNVRGKVKEERRAKLCFKHCRKELNPASKRPPSQEAVNFQAPSSCSTKLSRLGPG